MRYAIAAPGQAVARIAGSDDVFPVHRVYCVGRNYADHALEMGQREASEPFFFCKPADAVFTADPEAPAKLAYPAQTARLHHEVELVVALGAGGADVPAGRAAGLVWGYAVGLDLTRRDLQTQLKEQARPWEIAKSFDRSAPVSPIRPAQLCGSLRGGRIWLEVNGQARQDGDLAHMIWGVEEILAHLSRYFCLQAGDLVFTGTPSGVGAIVPGDRVRAGIDGVGSLALDVIERAPSGG
jgi:fumarylpyruvate hydrolase